MLLYLQIPLKCLKRKWIFYLTRPPNWALSRNRRGTSWWWTILSFPHFICCPNHYRNPTDMPIICGISGLNEKICQYVDYYLQPFVLQLAWYVGDSSYLISQLSQVTVPDGAIVVTFAVDSLYTIIKHEVGIHAVTYFLDKQLDSEFQQHARRLFCYIDDIAFIWTGTLTECQEFFNVLN